MAFPLTPTKGMVHTEFGETFFYNGISWSKGFVKQVNGVDCVFDSSEPTSPEEGLLFFDYRTNQIKKYVSGSWTLLTNV